MNGEIQTFKSDLLVQYPDIVSICHLANLSKRETDYIAWRFVYGCTYKEIGKIDRGITASAVRGVICHALCKLRRPHAVIGETELHDWL